ncbi:MAG: DinB family protein [Candidatus Eisenbacteria bacterium]
MELENPGEVLAASARTLESLVRGVSEEQARWRPDGKGWAIVEVISHLLDEERDDFRKRIRLTLEDPTKPWPPIDPEGWARDRDYLSWDLLPTLDAFLEERRHSVEWLNGLGAVDWTIATRFEHPLGSMQAGQLLASWIAHDFLHARQLLKLHFQYRERQCAPFDTAYAGSW